MRRYYVEIGGQTWALDSAIVERYICFNTEGPARILRTPFTGLEIIIEEVSESGL